MCKHKIKFGQSKCWQHGGNKIPICSYDFIDKMDKYEQTELYKKDIQKIIDESLTIIYNTIPPIDLNIITEYTKSLDIREYLNGEIVSPIMLNKIQTFLKYMTQIFKKLEPIKRPIVLYRSIYIPDMQTHPYKEGDILDILFTSFSSCSLYRVAPKFNSYDNTIFKIYIPAGTKVLYIGDLSYYKYENEVLLPPNIILQIVKKSTNELIPLPHSYVNGKSNVNNVYRACCLNCKYNSDYINALTQIEPYPNMFNITLSDETLKKYKKKDVSIKPFSHDKQSYKKTIYYDMDVEQK